MDEQKSLSAEQQENLLNTLEARFAANPQRHAGADWAAVRARLESRPKKL